MKVIPQSIPDVLLIEPRIFKDSRGYFFESYNEEKFQSATGLKINWVQDNESKSTYGVLRGLHFQKPPMAQAKLVRVLQGKVLDVAVDVRPDSPTFGQHVSAILSNRNKKQLFIPRGFAHGFLVLSKTAVFAYKCDNLYAPKYDSGVYHADPQLKIDWQIPLKDRIISEKDQKLVALKRDSFK